MFSHDVDSRRTTLLPMPLLLRTNRFRSTRSKISVFTRRLTILSKYRTSSHLETKVCWNCCGTSIGLSPSVNHLSSLYVSNTCPSLSLAHSRDSLITNNTPFVFLSIESRLSNHSTRRFGFETLSFYSFNATPMRYRCTFSIDRTSTSSDLGHERIRRR